MARIGEIIEGKYEIIKEIGRGGMSVVYLAMDKRLNKQWAIKEPRGDKNDSKYQVMVKSLVEEANLMKKLDHPTLPRIVDIIQNTETVYIVMDYIEGEPMHKVLDNFGAQPQDAVVEWAKQLSEVLDYLHTQTPPIIYRDMKPSNIMLKPDGTIRLFDFGIAREYKEGQEGDTEWLGTRGYAAPESFGGKGQTDPRTDIYSLGVTLYHLVTGKNPSEPPYEIYPIRHWNPSLSAGLERLIMKCTQLDPAERFQSCAEVSYYLDNLRMFDEGYIKKQRGKINLFITFVILTGIFGMLSAGSFIGGNAVKSNSYGSLIEDGKNNQDVDKYIEAINIDPSNPEAYEGLMEILYAQSSENTENSEEIYFTIIPGSANDNTEYKYRISYDDFESWFSDEHFESIKSKEENLEKYIKLNTDKGRLLWDCFGLGTSVRNQATSKAHRCFRKAVTSNINNETNAINRAVYNRTLIYYLISYFQVHKGEILNADDVEQAFMVDPSESEITQIVCSNTGKEIFSNDYYLCYWGTLSNCVGLLDSFVNSEQGNEISNNAALECINLIINNCTDSDFNAELRIDDDKVTDMLNKLKGIAGKLEANIENEKDENRRKQEEIKLASFKNTFNIVCDNFASNNNRDFGVLLDNMKFDV